MLVPVALKYNGAVLAVVLPCLKVKEPVSTLFAESVGTLVVSMSTVTAAEPLNGLVPDVAVRPVVPIVKPYVVVPPPPPPTKLVPTPAPPVVISM